MRLSLACAVLLAVVVSSQNTSVVNRTTSSCLSWLTTLVYYQTSSVGADIDEIGCYSWSQLQLSNTSVSNASVSAGNSGGTLAEKLSCAASCAGRHPTQSLVQFVLAYGACYCDAPTQYRGIQTSSGCCPEPSGLGPAHCASGLYGLVYQLSLFCRINAADCLQTPQCEVKAGCCVPDGSVNDDVPLHVTLMQWLASLLMVAIVLQALWWSIRMRLRRSRGDEALLQVPARAALRTKMQAVESATDALPYFASIPRHRVDAEANCGICLEKLSASPCVLTSCSHTLHAGCLKDYLAHGLRSMTADIHCPMCRCILVVQVSAPRAGSDTDVRSPEPPTEAALLNGEEPPQVIVLNAAPREQTEEEEMMERL